MGFGRKVTIYLADGTPSGIRHVEIANWSGQAIACPRSRLNELRQWTEAQRPGVYFLLEKQTAETGDRAYIGESENVVKRLSQQDKNQDFWNEVIVFTSKDENLTKAHIKYLESRLTAISIEADRYKIENGNTPTESTLPRADKDAMEEFVHNLRIVLGTLGHRVLEPIKATVIPSSTQDDSPKLSQFEFTFSIRGLNARGQQTDDGFVLFKEPLIKSTLSLRAAKGLYARRSSQRMAVALRKSCNNADSPLAARPKGLAGLNALGVAASRRAASMPSSRRLDCDQTRQPETSSI